MGYGPLVRATTGVSRLWTSDDDPGFYDATTIFPDHVVARITAIAALASLIGRERTGTGAHVHIAHVSTAGIVTPIASDVQGGGRFVGILSA